MEFAAGDGEDSVDSSNLLVHLLRFSIQGLCLLIILINRSKFKSSKIIMLAFIWMIWMILCNTVDISRYFINLSFTLFWPLILLSFNALSKYDVIYIKRMPTFICILYIVNLLFYIYVLQFKNQDIEGKLASVSHVYYIILLLPWILTFKNKTVKNLLLLLTIIVTVLSAKRGAILTVGLIAIIYLYFDYIVFMRGVKKIYGVVIGMVLGLLIVYSFIYLNDINDGYLLQRFENVEEDKGSGRLYIYEEVLHLYDRLPWEMKLFGASHNSVIKTTSVGLSAHNDYLEVLYDYGIIGFFLLISFLLIIIRNTRHLYRIRSRVFVAYFASLIIFLIMTMVSHLILYPTYIIYLASFWGGVDKEISS